MAGGRRVRDAEAEKREENKRYAAHIREVLARSRDKIEKAERFIEAKGGDSRRFGLAPRAGGSKDPVNMGTYRRQTNAKGWPKLRL